MPLIGGGRFRRRQAARGRVVVEFGVMVMMWDNARVSFQGALQITSLQEIMTQIRHEFRCSYAISPETAFCGSLCELNSMHLQATNVDGLW